MALDANNFPTCGFNANSSAVLPDVNTIIMNMNRQNALQAAQRKAVPPQPKPIQSPRTTTVNPNIESGSTSSDMPPPSAVIQAPPLQIPIRAVSARVQPKKAPTYFEDPLGNKYKMEDDKLYSMCWQDTDLQIRLVNAKTEKEVSTEGKKFQIFGWHLVKQMDAKKNNKVISNISKAVNVDTVVHKLTDTATNASSAASTTTTNTPTPSQDKVAEQTKTTATPINTNVANPAGKRIL